MKGASQAEVQAQIEHERIIEFPLESYRWYDLRRWGKLSEVLGKRGFRKVSTTSSRFLCGKSTQTLR